MTQDINLEVDATPVVAAMLKVLIEPYRLFLKRLRDEGRITDDELKQLRQDLLDRGAQLPEITRAELQGFLRRG
jgi:hypothetical protein